MNIQRSKGVVWLASFAVGGYLLYFVVDFLRRKPELAREVSTEELSAVLDSIQKPAEPQKDVVEYTQIQAVFHQMDWTGKPPPEVQPAAPLEAAAAPKVPIKDLLKVLVVTVDTVDAKKSLGWVKFTEQKLQAHNDLKEDRILRMKERLFSPYQDVRVEAVTPEGIVFAFDDAAREKETVPPVPYNWQRGELGIVVVEPGGAIQPQLERRIPFSAPRETFRPGQSLLIRKNEWQVGTETLKELDRDYSRILSRDLSYSTYRDPRTGAVEGIKVTRVAPDSLPAQHGVTEGEILKSINGHKVTSVNDAVAFVKANADSTDTWVAVFEKQGREFTRTYHSPQE